MLHLAPEQYRFLLETFDQYSFGLTSDIDTDLEVIGAGLDATLRIGALAYEDRYGRCFAFYRIELFTFIDGGRSVPNDFDPEHFIALYRNSR